MKEEIKLSTKEKIYQVDKTLIRSHICLNRFV